MRGKAEIATRGLIKSRITPAYAGKSFALRMRRAVSRDHPRICGEKKPSPGKICGLIGSPPHMRGKGQFHTGVIAMTGITPAYAGKRLGTICRTGAG